MSAIAVGVAAVVAVKEAETKHTGGAAAARLFARPPRAPPPFII